MCNFVLQAIVFCSAASYAQVQSDTATQGSIYVPDGRRHCGTPTFIRVLSRLLDPHVPFDQAAHLARRVTAC
ncbi:MAG: hypothetical protein ACR2OV_06110, partial [Hyphomicrobiaceae bacterium]